MRNASALKHAMKTLLFALSLKRPHKGVGVERLKQQVAKFSTNSFTDPYGNVHIDLRTHADHRSLFVAHMDTVHRTDGRNMFKREAGKLCAHQAPLGADDGAGVAILAALVYSNVPGYYLFTQGEEVGGIGAKYVRESYLDLLKTFDRAIAFDRKNTYSVITHQSFGRCASEEFAHALSDQLNDLGMLYMPDDSGVYTDTAEFADVIAECTNISCGYFKEHTQQEWLDLTHFRSLVLAVLRIDWDKLPIKRDAQAFELFDDGWYRSMGELNNIELAYGYDLDDESEALLFAIEDAFSGRDTKLKSLIVQAVNPYEAKLVEQVLFRKELTDEVLNYGCSCIGLLHPTDILFEMLELIDATLVP